MGGVGKFLTLRWREVQRLAYGPLQNCSKIEGTGYQFSKDGSKKETENERRTKNDSIIPPTLCP